MAFPCTPVDKPTDPFVCVASTTATPVPTGVNGSGTILVAGTIQPSTPDEWECVLGGTPLNGDAAQVVVGTNTYSAPVSGVLTDEYAVQLGGAIGTGDLIHVDVTVAGVTKRYTQECGPATTKAAASAEMATSCTSGSTDIYKGVIGGGAATGGNTATCTIDGVTYTYTCAGGDVSTVTAAGLAAAIAADPFYAATAFFSTVKLTGKTRGVSKVVTFGTTGTPTVVGSHTITAATGQATYAGTSNGVATVTFVRAAGATADSIAASVTLGAGSTTATATHTQTGTSTGKPALLTALVAAAAADPVYVVTDDGVATITLTAAAVGGGSPTVASGYSPSLGTGTFVATHTVVGVPGDVAAVIDQYGLYYAYNVAIGATTDLVATGLAAAINAAALYSAAAVGSTITASAVAPGYAYSMFDRTVNYIAGGVAIHCTPTLVSGGTAVKDLSSLDCFDCRGRTNVYIACNLVSGTSYKVTPWLYTDLTSTWAAGAGVVVNADITLTVPTAGADAIYLQMDTFVGGGTATIALTAL